MSTQGTKKTPVHKFISIWLDRTGGHKPNRPEFQAKELATFNEMLIREEFEELMLSLPKQEDMQQLCDDYFDLLWVITQSAMQNGINIDDLVRAGSYSNLSKFCKSEEEAIETQIAYSSGTHPDKKDVVVDTYYEKVEDAWIMKRVGEGKIMKSINFQHPDFSFIVNRMIPIKKGIVEKIKGWIK